MSITRIIRVALTPLGDGETAVKLEYVNHKGEDCTTTGLMTPKGHYWRGIVERAKREAATIVRNPL